MNTQKTENVFNRSGLAALSDLRSPGYQSIFSQLEKEQEAFLKKEPEFRSKEYNWPRDPLHTWSRVWEYPYVYHHLKQWRATEGNTLHVADLGSGVTFFPFTVARLGYNVTCVDIDPVVGIDLPKAMKAIDYNPGQLDFRLCGNSHLPFSDEEVDIVYCISVLEHITNFDDTVIEIARILKSRGLFILTCDLNLQSDSNQLGVEEYKRLLNCIETYFTPIYIYSPIHPADMLTSQAGPYPDLSSNHNIFWYIWYASKQKILKPLLWRKPGPLKPKFPNLAVHGWVLKKKPHIQHVATSTRKLDVIRNLRGAK